MESNIQVCVAMNACFCVHQCLHVKRKARNKQHNNYFQAKFANPSLTEDGLVALTEEYLKHVAAGMMNHYRSTF